jgi:hypothetical protein
VVDVLDAGQLDDDLVIRGAVRRHDRLGDTELVHAAIDRLNRLLHRLGPALYGDVRLHLERVAPAAGRVAVIRQTELRLGNLAELSVRGGIHAFDGELAETDGFYRADSHVRGLQHFMKLFRAGFGFDANRVVSFDAIDHLNAALEVEAELDLVFGRSEGPNRQAGDAAMTSNFH